MKIDIKSNTRARLKDLADLIERDCGVRYRLDELAAKVIVEYIDDYAASWGRPDPEATPPMRSGRAGQ